MKSHTYAPVDAGFLKTAPIRIVVEQALACTPERLFEVFADAGAWVAWAGLKSVVWTSPPPVGLNTTRTVRMGSMEVNEQFLVWAPGRHLQFRLTDGSTGLIHAFLEDYQVVATPEGARLTWTLAVALRGPARLIGPIFRLIAKRQAGQAMARLAKWVAR